MLLDDDNLEIVEPVLGAIKGTLDLAAKITPYLTEVDPTSRDSNNPTRRIDLFAQQTLKSRLEIAFEGEVRFIAEEPEPNEPSIPDDLNECDVDVAFLDPIDGTDLWVRGFGNWCISTVIFNPLEGRIRAGFVGYSSGDIYWATQRFAYRRGLDGVDYKLEVSPPSDLVLRNASICFYGQKASNFLAVQKNLHVLQLLQDMQNERNRAEDEGEEAPRFRIYNLAGNPMMVRMTGSVGMPAAVDAVFELRGQKPYDVVPGAFIARQAGATIVDLLDRPLDLDQALRYHKRRMRYVLAATPDLASELVRALDYTPEDYDNLLE